MKSCKTQANNKMYRFLVFCIILSSVPYSHSLANTGEKLTAVWNKFWSTSCPLSTIVSRTRRSIELPNIDNSAEIFDYLFPLANVSPEAAGGSRSSSSSSIPTISTWMDDVVDLWQHECQRRHKNKSQKRKQRLQKRSSVRNQGMAVTPTPGQTETETGGVEDAVITWAGYLGNLSSSFYSSSSQQEPDEDKLSFSPPAPAAAPGFNPLSFLNADYFTTTITYPDDYEEESQSQGNTRKKYDGDVVKDREGDHNDDADIGEDVDQMEQAESQSKGSFQKSNYGKDEDKTESESDNSEEAEEEEEEDDQNDDDDDEEETTTKKDDDEATTKSSKSTDTTTAATTTTTTTAAPEDPYFSSYGGDIEYFFPILSFTIPFDGEITLLGFHGFKGMLPY